MQKNVIAVLSTVSLLLVSSIGVAEPLAEASAEPSRRSPEAMWTGVGLSILGAAGVVLGASLLIDGALCSDPNPDGECRSANLAPKRFAGGVALAGGGVALGLGVPLWVWGAQSVEPGAAARPLLELRVGAGSASLVHRF